MLGSTLGDTSEYYWRASASLLEVDSFGDCEKELVTSLLGNSIAGRPGSSSLSQILYSESTNSSGRKRLITWRGRLGKIGSAMSAHGHDPGLRHFAHICSVQYVGSMDHITGDASPQIFGVSLSSQVEIIFISVATVI